MAWLGTELRDVRPGHGRRGEDRGGRRTRASAASWETACWLRSREGAGRLAGLVV